MFTQKQWKIQQMSDYMLSLATTQAVEAARRAAARKPMVQQHAVIAEETRRIAVEIKEALEKNIFNGFAEEAFDKIMKETAKRTAFLALNTALLSCKVYELKPLAVFADELRTVALELAELYGNPIRYHDVPVVSQKSRVITDGFDLFSAVSGEFTWCENARFVIEILNYSPDLIQGNRLILKNEWRDMDMPFIKLGDTADNPGIVIISDSADVNKQYAVLAEFRIHSLTNSYVGMNVPCSANIPVRECWLASDGSEMIFPDWGNLALCE